MAKYLGLFAALIVGAFLFVSSLTFASERNVTPTVAQAGALDGKTFVGEFGKKGKKTEGKDELIFKDGKFHSKACDPYGFGDGVYTATVSGDTTTFETETGSTKEGKIKWMGTVKGDVIDVTYTWYRSPKWYRFSNAPIEYWFKGELKK
jgi:hypothetical protein